MQITQITVLCIKYYIKYFIFIYSFLQFVIALNLKDTNPHLLFTNSMF